jgi:hypothetical protein
MPCVLSEIAQGCDSLVRHCRSVTPSPDGMVDGPMAFFMPETLDLEVETRV